jgi:hypothetical protein
VKTAYETDIVAWANEQAEFIRAGQYDQLDLTHLAEEIEDVGKSEQREIMSRMAVLLAHLLKWEYQSDKRTNSWGRTIKNQRELVNRALVRTPSLKPQISNPEWIADAWVDALAIAEKETGLEVFPDACPWDLSQVLITGWLPSKTTA